MSYEPTNWQAGDTVTSAKLNKIEQGIANCGIRIVHTVEIETSGELIQDTSEGELAQNNTQPAMRLDITPNDLKNMLNNGQLPILYEETSKGYKMYISFSGYAEHVDDASYMCYFGETMDGTYVSTNLDEYFIWNQDLK